MSGDGVRSIYSGCPVRLLLSNDQGLISTGTGFFYLHGGTRFLITNWHVVSGKDVFTGRLLDEERGWIPTRIALRSPSTEGRATGRYGIDLRENALYEDTDRCLDPLWFEHPDHSTTPVDVVAIPCTKSGFEPVIFHREVNQLSDIKIPVRPGQPAFIIGFPEAIEVDLCLPVWKSASIASEPFFDVTIGEVSRQVGEAIDPRRIRAFFVDGQTRRGMSGSPIFASFTGTWNIDDPYKPVASVMEDSVVIGGSAMQFVGVYSGRVSARENQAALGICWKEELIQEICAAAVAKIAESASFDPPVPPRAAP